jgi:hypothetical protein
VQPLFSQYAALLWTHENNSHRRGEDRGLGPGKCSVFGREPETQRRTAKLQAFGQSTVHLTMIQAVQSPNLASKDQSAVTSRQMSDGDVQSLTDRSKGGKSNPQRSMFGSGLTEQAGLRQANWWYNSHVLSVCDASRRNPCAER